MKKNILITGGATGIGYNLALNFNKLNYNVIITYNNSVDNIKNLEENNIDCYKLEITDYNECQNITKNILEKYKNIDILINNIGILNNALFHKMTYDQWNNVIDVNLKSIYNITHPIINNMLLNKYGRIINISSISGLKGSKGQTNYCSSKFGIVGFTKSLALDYANSNITVNCICPSLVNTDLIKSIKPEILDKIINNIPIKKLIEPYEIFKICNLIIDSEYSTGSVYNIDCGMNC
jgi:acetoacetyl-CoA reductase